MVAAGQHNSRGSPSGVHWWMTLLLTAVLVSGCSLPKMPRAIDDTDPTAKIPAIKASAATRDRKSITRLINDLDSDDPAVRFYAIRALKDITGETFDYRYFDDELERREEMLAWRQWLAKETGVPMPATMPTSSPSTTTSPATKPNPG